MSVGADSPMFVVVAVVVVMVVPMTVPVTAVVMTVVATAEVVKLLSVVLPTCDQPYPGMTVGDQEKAEAEAKGLVVSSSSVAGTAPCRQGSHHHQHHQDDGVVVPVGCVSLVDSSAGLQTVHPPPWEQSSAAWLCD